MKIKLLGTLLLFSSSLFSQTTLYTNDFSAGGGDFTLGQGNNFDYWVVNKIYNCSDVTPDQGGGNYMHIYDDLFAENCAFSGFYGSGGGGTVYATKKTNVITTGYTSVTLTFDWLCKGQTGSILPSYGFFDISTDGGNSWTNVTQPLAVYSGQASWTTVTITSAQVPALLNQTALRFRYGFQNSGYGLNPAFAVDNIKVVGNTSSGINDNFNIDVAGVHPNPFSGSTTIELAQVPSHNTILTVVDLRGKEVRRMEVTNKSIVLEQGDLSPGVYFVRISDNSGNQSAVRKVVVQ